MEFPTSNPGPGTVDVANAADPQPSEVARRYCDLTVAIVALDERVRALQAATDRIEEVLGSILPQVDHALTHSADALDAASETTKVTAQFLERTVAFCDRIETRTSQLLARIGGGHNAH